MTSMSMNKINELFKLNAFFTNQMLAQVLRLVFVLRLSIC